ncbi:hypothetical protein BHM03_00049615 [Ensete ventricosum]|nr:hypothetical protein BHM03_00049615 [Ensete ventricosum]
MLPAVRRGTDDLRSSGGDIAVRRPTHGGLLQAPWRGLQAQFHRPTGFQVQFQFGIGPGFELLIVFSYSERGLLMYDPSTSQDVTVDAHELLVSMPPGTVPGCDGIYDPSLLVTEAFSSVGDGQLPDSLGQQTTCTNAFFQYALCRGTVIAHRHHPMDYSPSSHGRTNQENMNMWGMDGWPMRFTGQTHAPRQDLMQLSSSSPRQRHTPHHAALLHLGRSVFRTHRALPNPGQAPPRVGRAQAAEMTNARWRIRRPPGAAETLNSSSVLHPREMRENYYYSRSY